MRMGGGGGLRLRAASLGGACSVSITRQLNYVRGLVGPCASLQKQLREHRRALQDILVTQMKAGKLSTEQSEEAARLQQQIKTSEAALTELALGMVGRFSTPMGTGRAMLF